MAGDVGDAAVLARQVVLDLVHGVVLVVDRADQHVVGDVVQVTAELEPRPGGADVVRRALSLHLPKQITSVGWGGSFAGIGCASRPPPPYLDEDLHVLQIGAAPFVEGFQQLQPVALRVDVDREAGAVGGRVLVSVLARVEAPGRQLVPIGRLQLELLAVGGGQVVGLRVEAQRAGDGEGGDDLRKGSGWDACDFTCESVREKRCSVVLALPQGR